MNKDRFKEHPKTTLTVVFSLLFLIIIFLIEVVLSFTASSQTVSNQTRYIRLKEHPPSVTHYISRNPQYIQDRNTTEDDYRFKTDADGYIFPSRIHNQADINLLFLGGSTTECAAVDEKNRFPYLAGRLLESEGITLNAFNSGVSGNHSMHSINILLNKGMALKPDIAFMMHNINDLNFLLYENSYWNNNPSRWGLLVGHKSDTIQHIKSVIKSIVPQIYNRLSILKNQYFNSRTGKKDEFSHLRGKPKSFNHASVIEQFKRSLLTFVSIARANQIYPVLMTQANRLKENPDKLFTDSEHWMFFEDFGLNYLEYKVVYDAMNEAIREVAKTNEVLLIDLADEVPQEKKYMYDGVHFTNFGSKFVASIVSRRLKDVLGEELHEMHRKKAFENTTLE